MTGEKLPDPASLGYEAARDGLSRRAPAPPGERGGAA